MSSQPPAESGSPGQQPTQPDPAPGSGPSVTSPDVEGPQLGEGRQETPHQPYDQQVPPGYGEAGSGLEGDGPEGTGDPADRSRTTVAGESSDTLDG
jgi:hypothetical protein